MSAALFKIKVQAKHTPTGLFETISSVRGHATAVAGQCGLNSKSLQPENQARVKMTLRDTKVYFCLRT